MSRGRGWRKLLFLLLGVAVLGIAVWSWRQWGAEERVFPVLDVSRIALGTKLVAAAGNGGLGQKQMPSYGQWLRSIQEVQEDKQPITIMATSYTKASTDAGVIRRTDQVAGEVIDWTQAAGWVEWEIEVPKDGLYTLGIEYMPLKGSFAGIVRGLQIDGQYPFIEAERLSLERLWKDGIYPYERNALGNEIRPVQEELVGWRTTWISNYEVSSEPLLWPLTEGRHSIRLTGGREPVSLAAMTLSTPVTLPAYQAYRGEEEAKAEGHPTGDGTASWYEIIEAENYARKSAIGIQTQSTAEAFASPDPKGRIVYNAIGGDRWAQAGDWIEWEFTVPETGMYALDLKYFQGYNGKSKSYRTIMLDEQVPFRELLHYALPPNGELGLHTLSDDSGEAYFFRLERGVHRLRMIADRSPVSPAVEGLRDILSDLNTIERDVRVITGNYGAGSNANLDTGRSWDILTYDPHMQEKLQDLIARMQVVRDYVDGLNQHVTDPTTAIASAMNSLQKLADRVNEIPNRISLFAEIQTSINTWIRPLESQGLMLDSIIVRQPDAELGLKQPNLWDKVRYSTINFGRTFFQSYDLKDMNDAEAITVWVQRGRDYVDLLQKMIESDFTPQTGIRVNVNLMPSANVLMLGNAAGDQPDVALGLGMETPVDYAMRGAAADLRGFANFEKIASRFQPGIMRSYAYNGGMFALPETQSFMVMFYRTDVLEQLGLTPPDTWEDMLSMLPTLQEKGMSVYYPTKEFVTPFYQHGAEFYSTDGLQVTMESKEGQLAFQHWTDFFTKSDLPKEVPAFFNHFRFGDMPIGIADFNTYIQLTVAAPEIMGRWKMAPLPGVRNEAGEVVRWSTQMTSAGMIMEKSENKEQAWKFLDWWTSTQVQGRFASDIESFAGIEFRWSPANMEALHYVPWPEEDMKVLAEQGKWGKNVPYVPGYYMLGREMDFAWNNTVLKGMPPKEALGKASRSLQREMTRKQQELGLRSDADLQVPTVQVDRAGEKTTSVNGSDNNTDNEGGSHRAGKQ